MALVSAEEALKLIPALFEINLNTDKDGNTIFKKLSSVINFDEGFIYFLNPDSLQLKYTYKTHANYKINEVFPMNEALKKRVYTKNGEILNSDSELVSTVGLSELKKKSYIMAKIAIKSTVFGIILLTKQEANFYNHSDLTVLNAASSVLSYILKDLELANVFKIQLQALKDGLIEKNEAYKTIKEQNEKILEADKVKNEFLANISHELRTPLNSILGFSDILGAKLYGDLNHKQEEYVNDIKVSATHLLGMINGILDMSKIEANAMKIVKSTFWITRAIDEVANILAPLADKKGVKIVKNLKTDFQVYADYQKIQQILYNLVSNAIKFTPKDGQVDILATYNETSFKLVVHDTGIGIDEKYHGKIFAKFVQLDSAYTKKESSTGLGLTITKELAELHGGKISVVSEINNGSTFIVEIPQNP
ncbi:MAG: HAMP domain-containing histidine kinase [Candidatus Gastranaerophilales bacterium]|nr:HAMP domain-containing histidine kinase [Candidatus Gastranaerophilales bacterium]MCM1073213.1 HAMP domain-containing histidine kinase [Bacteroides sp.]